MGANCREGLRQEWFTCCECRRHAVCIYSWGVPGYVLAVEKDGEGGVGELRRAVGMLIAMLTDIFAINGRLYQASYQKWWDTACKRACAPPRSTYDQLDCWRRRRFRKRVKPYRLPYALRTLQAESVPDAIICFTWRTTRQDSFGWRAIARKNEEVRNASPKIHELEL
ncbi:MAG: hypothetical protein HYS59_00430 [Candidatus Vogelbacteria bacterium]|nr:hypothetical protein [Candidatus Vogelbacteria bacterium]